MTYSDWIDVKDDQPKKDQRVLCVQDPNTTATKEALFSKYNGKVFIPIDEEHRNYISHWCDIILWMPLPKVPRACGFELFNAFRMK